MQELLKTLALAYQYPAAGSSKRLWERFAALPASSAKALLERFLNATSELTLSEREELYTRTLDLTPLTAPYIAYSVYGEDYRRGTFMATMNRELAKYQVDTSGELPDHLIPVLRYLAVIGSASMHDAHPQVAPEPLPELLELLEPALRQIHHTLKVLDKHNPYLTLIEATQQAVEPLCKEQVLAPKRAKSREQGVENTGPVASSPQPELRLPLVVTALGPLQSLSSLLKKGGLQ